MNAVPLLPVRGMPMMRLVSVPSGRTSAPPKVPWPDSTRPMPARAHHSIPQVGAQTRMAAAAFQ
ncbi:hypothetical protein BH24ACT4_BH24ACT4_13960 [soil metagenome]